MRLRFSIPKFSCSLVSEKVTFLDKCINRVWFLKLLGASMQITWHRLDRTTYKKRFLEAVDKLKFYCRVSHSSLRNGGLQRWTPLR
jgi:hypothetical protein